MTVTASVHIIRSGEKRHPHAYEPISSGLMDGKWQRHGQKSVYDNEWVHVDLIDIELPDGQTLEHHAVRARTNRAVGMLCYDEEKGVLLIWRHRFINDKWGWELPAGGVDPGEKPEVAAKRELLEETGWAADTVTSFLTYSPMAGFVESQFEIFYTETAKWVGPGRDTNEAADLAWTPLDQLRTLIRDGEINEGLALTALLYAFQFGPLAGK